MKTTVTTTLEIDLDISTVARWFAELDDDSQCQFFVAVAEHAKGWTSHQDSQWFNVGRHLKDCKCSTVEARSMIETIGRAMNYETSQPK